jgi:hypothetical protein
MKSKKALRKLHPLTKALAKLQRDMHSIERRMDKLIKFADEIEQEGRTNLRQQAELRGRLAVAEGVIPGLLWPSKPGRDTALGPELPNGEGTIPAGGEIEQGGKGAGYHAGSDADPRD